MLTAAIPEFRLPCDMVEASHFTPALMHNYYNNDRRDAAALQSLRLGQPLGLGQGQGQGRGHGNGPCVTVAFEPEEFS